jgi:Creatinine amidohydrolase
MNGPDHYREAERLLDEAISRGDFNPRAEWCLELAKLHTALAHVAATAQASDGREWVNVAGPCFSDISLSGADWTDARHSARLSTSHHEDMHAGELETSMLLNVHPELVRDGYQSADWVADGRRHLLTTGMAEYTQSGVTGRPSLASAEKEKTLLAALVESFASVLEILRRHNASSDCEPPADPGNEAGVVAAALGRQMT